MSYQVTAPLVQALKADGGYVHVDEGGFLPDDQDPVQLEQLLAAGMVEEAEEPTDDEGKASRSKSGKASRSKSDE